MLLNLSRKVAIGAVWMVLFRLIERGLGIVSMLILARMLTPADFGIVAMGMSVIALLELFTSFGFDVALIQNRHTTPAHYNTAWTLKIILAGLVTILMVSLAPSVASYYREPGVEWVIYALSVAPLATALQNIGIVAFRKELDFRREFRFQLIRKLAGFLVTVPLAIWTRSYWALVAGMLASQFVAAGLSYWLHPFRPRFALSESRGMLGFSKWLLLGNLADSLQQRVADLVIGRLGGASSLGLYTLSQQLGSLPTSELSAPINRALLPGFAKSSASGDQIPALYQSAMAVMTLFAIPAACGIYAVAHLLIPVALGPKWLAAIPLVQIFAISGVLMLLSSSISALLMGTGSAKDVTIATCLYATFLIAGLLILTPTYGLQGAAVANLVAASALFPIFLGLIRYRLGLSPLLFLATLRRPLAGSLVLMLALWAILPSATATPVSADISSLIWLFAGIFLGITFYTATVLLIWLAEGRPEGAERIILREIRKRIGPRETGESHSLDPRRGQ